MNKKLTVAMSESDRTASIMNGEEKLPPFELEPYKASVEEIFVSQIQDAKFDIAELSLASYLIALGQGERRLTAIPVFLSRSFRHNAIYVREDVPWVRPEELRNRRFGFPEYQMTAAVWVRAFFRHEWGVPTDEIDWYTYRPERYPVQTPAKRGQSDNLYDALVNGEVDAIMSARRPPEKYFSRTGKGGAIRRLFPNVWQEERDYFKKTGIFPIMHLVSLRKETVEQYPQLPKILYEMMLTRKNGAVAQLLETVKNTTSAPFLWESVEDSMQLMDGDIWPYGTQANWKQIETFMSYLKEDGLLNQTLSIEQVFDPSVLDT